MRQTVSASSAAALAPTAPCATIHGHNRATVSNRDHHHRRRPAGGGVRHGAGTMLRLQHKAWHGAHENVGVHPHFGTGVVLRKPLRRRNGRRRLDEVPVHMRPKPYTAAHAAAHAAGPSHHRWPLVTTSWPTVRI